MGAILVTGASGFIGTVLVRRLGGAGIEVLRGVRMARDAAEVSLDLSQPVEIVIPKGVDAIAHLAQSRAYRDFPADSGAMFAVNVAGTLALLQAAVRAGVKRICLVSSGTVYEPFYGPLVEDAAIAPRSFLGASKAAAEILARPFGKLIDLSILRLFTPYGPGQEGRMIPNLIARIREGRAVTLEGSGNGLLFAPTYVDDVCNVIVTALEERWTDTVNVATPEVINLRQAATIIGEIVGKPPVFENRPGLPINLAPDIGVLSRRYPVGAFTSFSDGVSRVVSASRLGV